MPKYKLVKVEKGGKGSGHFGHSGRPGKQGGSSPGAGGGKGGENVEHIPLSSFKPSDWYTDKYKKHKASVEKITSHTLDAIDTTERIIKSRVSEWNSPGAVTSFRLAVEQGFKSAYRAEHDIDKHGFNSIGAYEYFMKRAFPDGKPDWGDSIHAKDSISLWNMQDQIKATFVSIAAASDLIKRNYDSRNIWEQGDISNILRDFHKEVKRKTKVI